MKNSLHILDAILAAALYALSSPLSKLLLSNLEPTMLAGLLYAGAGIGMGAVGLLRRPAARKNALRFEKSDRIFLLMMVALDVAAPILLLIGLRLTSAANASLLNNFEIVATSLFAFLVFRETISKRVWIGIALVTAASVLLSFSEDGALAFSPGSLLILAAAICWGLENNCTRMLSTKDPLSVVVVKGLGSGAVSLLIALLTGGFSTDLPRILAALLVGFVSYGLSIFLYVTAQAKLGAAKTSAYYAVAPFIGAGLSLLLFRTIPGVLFLVALAILVAGTWFTSFEPRHRSGLPTP